MRIISKFTDYYDCGQSYGIDPNLIYFRTPQKLTFGPSHDRHSLVVEACSSVPKCPRIGSFQRAILGFCGKLYRVFTFDDDNSGGADLSLAPFLTSGGAVARIRKRVEERSYDPRLLRIARAWLDERDQDMSSNEWYRKGDCRFDKDVKRSDWEHLTQTITHPCHLELFHLLQTPIFIMQSVWMEQISVNTNISLKDTGFIQFFDPFTAYQEIAMFLGGVLALPKDNPPLTVGDDRIIAQQKGFDDQSFRGPNKGEVEARRKANRLKKRGLES